MAFAYGVGIIEQTEDVSSLIQIYAWNPEFSSSSRTYEGDAPA